MSLLEPSIAPTLKSPSTVSLCVISAKAILLASPIPTLPDLRDLVFAEAAELSTPHTSEVDAREPI